MTLDKRLSLYEPQFVKYRDNYYYYGLHRQANVSCGFPSLSPSTPGPLPGPGRDHVSCHRTSLPATGGDIAGAVPAPFPTSGAHGLAAEPPRLPVRAAD